MVVSHFLSKPDLYDELPWSSKKEAMSLASLLPLELGYLGQSQKDVKEKGAPR